MVVRLPSPPRAPAGAAGASSDSSALRRGRRASPQAARTAGGSAGTRTRAGRIRGRCRSSAVRPWDAGACACARRHGERQAGRGEGGELRADLGGELAADARRDGSSDARGETGREGNQPARSTQIGNLADGGSTAGPSITTRCSPTRRSGMARARRTASAAAGPATIRLAAVQHAVAVRPLDRLVDRSGKAEIVGGAAIDPLQAGRPSAATRPVALPQELEELDAFAQPALHHLRAAHHLAHDRGDLRRAEVELPDRTSRR